MADCWAERMAVQMALQKAVKMVASKVHLMAG
jgi:hypothetical protein